MKKLLLPIAVVLTGFICQPAMANSDVSATETFHFFSNFRDPGSLPKYVPLVIRERAVALGSHRVALEYSGKRRGIAKVLDATGKVLLEAGFKNHKLEGSWKTAMEEGQFAHGLPHGQWTYYNEQGDVTALRQYDAGKLVAVGRDLKYYNPKRNSSRIARMVKVHRMDLEDILMGNNELAGLRPPFTLALHHGEFINYYHGGQVKDSCAYKEGFRDGMFISYFTNGQMEWHGYLPAWQ